MKLLDSLKEDIYDYKKALKSNMEFLYLKIADLYKNYSKMDLNEINLEIEVIHDEIKLITCETRILRKIESYYKLFEEEQNNTTDDFDFMEAFEKWETEHTPNGKYKRQEISFNELLRSKPFNCTDRED